jgi:hypothetical protein
MVPLIPEDFLKVEDPVSGEMLHLQPLVGNPSAWFADVSAFAEEIKRRNPETVKDENLLKQMISDNWEYDAKTVDKFLVGTDKKVFDKRKPSEILRSNDIRRIAKLIEKNLDQLVGLSELDTLK